MTGGAQNNDTSDRCVVIETKLTRHCQTGVVSWSDCLQTVESVREFEVDRAVTRIQAVTKSEQHDTTFVEQKRKYARYTAPDRKTAQRAANATCEKLI